MILKDSEEIKLTKSGHKVKTVLVKCDCGSINRRSKSAVSKVEKYQCQSCANKKKKNLHRKGVSPSNRQIRCLIPCDSCGALRAKTRRQIDITEHTFCNNKCQIKWQHENTDFNKRDNNPAFKDGSRVDGILPNYGPEFNSKLKRAIKIRDNFNCQRCGANFSGRLGKKLDVHHIDENKYNNSMDNLVSFCKSCHTQVHWDLKKEK